MKRTVTGFRQDAGGGWVATLSCRHGQHVQHRPPFQDRPWVLTSDGRDEHVGTDADCPLCDRAELPGSLRLARTAGPFDASSLPAGLRRAHRTAEGVWAVLRVREGSADVTIETDPPISARLGPGENQAIPPAVPHAVTPAGAVILEVDFLVGDDPEP